MDVARIAFIPILILACSYVYIRGGCTGRIGAAILVVTSLLGHWFGSNMAWGQFRYDIALIDTACLMLFLLLAMRSDRYWPIWAAGLQQTAVLTHLGAAILPEISPAIYEALATFWKLPILVVMVAGTYLDLRSGEDAAP
ncbi:MAG: hypothetical protein V3V15_03240 [Sphingorhabdus sp.]